MKGTVKFFKSEKGFGFITGEDGVEYFAHYSQIQSEGFKTLEKGQAVTFEVAESPKGPNAVNIVKD